MGGAGWVDDDTLMVATTLGGEATSTTSGYPRTVRLWRRGLPWWVVALALLAAAGLDRLGIGNGSGNGLGIGVGVHEHQAVPRPDGEGHQAPAVGVEVGELAGPLGDAHEGAVGPALAATEDGPAQRQAQEKLRPPPPPAVEVEPN